MCWQQCKCYKRKCTSCKGPVQGSVRRRSVAERADRICVGEKATESIEDVCSLWDASSIIPPIVSCARRESSWRGRWSSWSELLSFWAVFQSASCPVGRGFVAQRQMSLQWRVTSAWPLVESCDRGRIRCWVAAGTASVFNRGTETQSSGAVEGLHTTNWRWN